MLSSNGGGARAADGIYITLITLINYFDYTGGVVPTMVESLCDGRYSTGVWRPDTCKSVGNKHYISDGSFIVYILCWSAAAVRVDM